MHKKKVSITDVARRAQVSITTVSRVMNNVSTVSDKNRVKVEEAVAFLKFKPNASAQRLARGSNNAIGLVMPGYPGIFHSFYAIELIRGVGHACEVNKKDMVFHITNGFNALNSNNVDGLIFADIIENKRQVDDAIAVGTPTMIINNEAKDLDASYIAIDNSNGGEQVADYLYSYGHRRIATITGNLNTQSGLQRFQGFQKYLEAKGVPLLAEYIVEGDYSRRSARVGMEKILSLKERPTAIFAGSDDMALEIIAVLMENNIKVPDDISVIGFDDNPACLFSSIGLTTIRQPLFEMAENAVNSLVSIIQKNSDDTIQKLLHPELVVRESCTSPKS